LLFRAILSPSGNFNEYTYQTTPGRLSEERYGSLRAF